MTVRSAVDRTVAVLAGHQGSGVMLTSRIVLTSAHVLEEESGIRVAHPGGGARGCELLWRDSASDAALLWCSDELLPPALLAPLGRLRWGRLMTRNPLTDCQIIGYPSIQRYGAGELECDQYSGTVLPMAGLMRETLVCELNNPPVYEPLAGGFPLAGLSGAPVFAGAVLLGIINEIPQGRRLQRAEGTSVETVLAAVRAAGITLPKGHELPERLEPTTDFHPGDEGFEARYRRALKTRYRKTEIFGIDELSTSESSWDLDTAYLSLEATASSRHPRAGGRQDEPSVFLPESSPQRVNDLLADRPRTVLRGEAGAGKTTLVWWLASHAACGTLGPDLAELNGLVPFVIPMRSLRALDIGFPTPPQLPTIAQLLVDEPPGGWAARVLQSGRGFLLVDGLDEIPRAERGMAHRWLSDLLSLYPETRCLVTVRPLAVEENWLRAEGFAELRLLPMSDDDIQAFVAAWHNAARLEVASLPEDLRSASEEQRLLTLERELSTEFARNTNLQNMARTPLLCAVICALHRRRHGLLPSTRWSLYKSALAMLLGGRDTLRRIGAPEGITLDVEEHQQLLQRIAVWLVRGGQAQLSHKQVRHQLSLAMSGMPRVGQEGNPDEVLTHLLNRSGILQERAENVIQFIHRTFQDYLAAKELQETDSLSELLQHATEEDWQDVILLAVGHCNRAQAWQLVEGLIAKGDRGSGRAECWSLHLLAAQCMLSAVYLEAGTRTAVEHRIRSLMPPGNLDEAKGLASLGPYALPLLPGPDGSSEAEATAIVYTICEVRGPRSIDLLEPFTRHPSQEVRALLAAAWVRFPDEQYARRILARTRLDDLTLSVGTPEMLSLVRLCGPVDRIKLFRPFTEAELLEHLPYGGAKRVELWPDGIPDDLPRLGDLRGLSVLAAEQESDDLSERPA